MQELLLLLLDFYPVYMFSKLKVADISNMPASYFPQKNNFPCQFSSLGEV